MHNSVRIQIVKVEFGVAERGIDHDHATHLLIDVDIPGVQTVFNT